VLFRVNNQLLESSKSGLFVTAWIGTLDLSNGHLIFASAGHPFPYLMRNGSNEYEMLKSSVNLVLGGFGNFKYKQSEVDMHHGDRLFLYTDGLDEARSEDGGFFGKDRIKKNLDENVGETIRGTVLNMKAAVDKYTEGTEQFDDLTMLTLEYRGGKADE
ncbi:MAG: serine/threonine-protein phosphatase, partial [Firmicutes bacterium]|nr:serine/threonine-protein phosphatase [Candidatus Colimorpha enterica]